MGISIKLNTSELKKVLSDIEKSQIPYAKMLTVNALAKGVQDAEGKGLNSTFSKPTPFTQNAYGVSTASKSYPTATVFMKDIQASYLVPYVDGGAPSFGNKQAMLVPKAVTLNQYGNLARNKLASLKGRKDVFIGAVKTSEGEIYGVWQRLKPPTTGRPRGRPKRGSAPPPPAQKRPRLKLLIRFDQHPESVKLHLDFEARAVAFVQRNAEAAFQTAFAKALETAK